MTEIQIGLVLDDTLKITIISIFLHKNLDGRF